MSRRGFRFGGGGARVLVWAAVALVCGAVVALATPSGRARVEGIALVALGVAPASTACDDRFGRLAVLAQGGALPDDACLGRLAGTPVSRALLVRLVRDSSRATAVRISALTALLRAAPGETGLATALLGDPSTAPELRASTLGVLLRHGERAVWAERVSGAAPHGLADQGLAALFALGEPGTALAVRDMLAAGVPRSAVMADIYEGLGTSEAALREGADRAARGLAPLGLPGAWRDAFLSWPCGRDCGALLRAILRAEAREREEEPTPRVPAPDAALDLAYAEDGAGADHVRDELAAVALWAGGVSPPRRAARVIAAVAHPAAAARPPRTALLGSGDPHAVLVDGGGSPGAVLWATTELAEASGVGVAAWVGATGVRVELDGRAVEVGACFVPGGRLGALGEARGSPGAGGGAFHDAAVPAGAEPGSAESEPGAVEVAPRAAGAGDSRWSEASSAAGPRVPVPPGGADALLLVESAARALRDGRIEGARLRSDAARSLWPAAPGLDAVEAAVLAAEGPPARASGPLDARPRRGAPAPSVGVGGPAPVTVGPLVGVPAADALLVSRPAIPSRRARRASAPLPDLRVEARAARVALVARVEALAPDARDRLRAAWFAADAGHSDVARSLLVAAGDPSALSAPLAALHAALVRALEGPGAGATGIPRARAPLPCPEPFRAEPPARAWREDAP